MHTNNLIAILLLCAASLSVSGASASGVVSYSIPSFNTTTTSTVDLLASTNSSAFGFTPGLHDDNSRFDRTEGFVLLHHRVEMRRSGAGGEPLFQASLNTSFTLGGVKPIAFVLLESIPLGGGSLRGDGNVTSFASPSVTDIAEVQVGPVMSSYLLPDGLNVTVTPRKPGGELAVWIEYDAVAQSLSVYVGGNGRQTKPSRPVLDATINLFVWPQTSNKTAYTGFFAGRIRDVINGVRDWNLTADKFPEESGAGGRKGASWLVVLLAVFGSAAAMSSM
jgi:hypothetical protein